MPLAAGTRIGQYEIVAPIGAGGMGEVLASLNHPNIAVTYGIEERPAEAGHYVRTITVPGSRRV